MSRTVMITGGAGFLGSELARRVLAEPVDRLLLLDLVAPADDLLADPRVEVVVGELSDTLAAVPVVDAAFHLAGVVSGAAEADFDLGLRTNLDQTRHLFEHLRRQAAPPVVVFSSSLAVFGDDPHAPLPAVIADDTLPRPQSSYGVQKFVAEQLLADYTRKGFLRGRSVRLMTTAVRPGRPNAAASSFVSGIIREPLAGERSVCPVPADLAIAVSSPRRTLEGILRAAAVDDDTWGSRTAMNLPALTTTPGEMAAALDRVAGEGTSELIDWVEDPDVVRVVGSWPGRFDTPRAAALGLHPEQSFDDIVADHAHHATAAPGGSA